MEKLAEVWLRAGKVYAVVDNGLYVYRVDIRTVSLPGYKYGPAQDHDAKIIAPAELAEMQREEKAAEVHGRDFPEEHHQKDTGDIKAPQRRRKRSHDRG